MPNTPLQRLKNPAWQILIGRLLILVLVALAIGLWFDLLWPAIAVALAIYIAISMRALATVESWLESRRTQTVPEDLGVISNLARNLDRRFRTERLQKRRVINLLRAFREAAAALPDGVVVFDHQLRLIWLNEAASQILNARLPRDRGQGLVKFLPQTEVQLWLQRTPESEPLLDLASPSNAAQRLALRVIPYRPDQRLLVMRDITKLQQLEQVRRDFVANVSHELRTPLTVLHGYLDLFEVESYPELATQHHAMSQQTVRMQNIVEDLLTLSRLDKGEKALQDDVSMTALFATLKTEALSLSQGRHRLQFKLESKAHIAGSNKELHSAFSNLIGNAIRYTPDGGAIEVRWQIQDDRGVFSVEDSGPGIAAEHLPRLTERFYRVSTSRSRESGGTGLGLAIVKHVLQQHDACLKIDSIIGQGSTFRCIFPPNRLTQPPAVPQQQ